MKKSLKHLPVGAQIVVGIAPDGSINSRVLGIMGVACAGFLENLEGLFETIEHGHTDEFDVETDAVTDVGASS